MFQNVFSSVVLIAAVAGLLMVVGGMWLIYKGAIILNNTNPQEAITIEWRQNFRMSTQVPGIAFFIVGLLFSSLAIWAAKPSGVEPIRIKGNLKGISDIVTIKIIPSSSSWTVQTGSNGEINGRIYPDIDVLTLELTAPGYDEEFVPYSLETAGQREIDLSKKNIVLRKKIDTIVGNQEDIIEPDVPLKPLGEKPSFGVSR